jgi:hypothetical protein
VNRAPARRLIAAWAAWRLALVRTLAWALLFAGWLVLGGLGRLHLAQWAGGQLPVALWLAGIGALLALAARRPLRVRAMLNALVGTGLVVGLALVAADRGGGAPAALAAALAWSGLLVAMSVTVRALRAAQARVPPAPLLPALAGAALAWTVHDSRLATVALVGSAVALTLAVLLASRIARTGQPFSACRAGLFDCSLPLPSVAAWRRSGDWPLHAATLVMLPMMAALPAMSEWCGAAPGWLGGVPAWHLGAMLLPALCLRPWLRRVNRPALNAGLAALLLAGALALSFWPGLNGLMVAELLHATAWSLAWATPMLERDAAVLPRQPSRVSPASATLAQASLVATAMLLLGLALDRFGPPALVAVHAGLAGLALLGLLLTWRGRGGARLEAMGGH